MSYTKVFEPLYEDGWEDLPIEETPITAEAFNNYDSALTHIEDYLEDKSPNDNIADAYDSTSLYDVGDYVIYDDVLYKCITAIVVPEVWNSSKWESCLVTDEMATSGGTTVIANPSGTATETLTKLQVEETIYGISGGGGSANIWEGTQEELEEEYESIPNDTVIIVTDDEESIDASADIYSTNERLVGLWTNNKPLYQKTFVTEATSITGNSDINVNSDISALGVDEVVTYNEHIIYTYTSSGTVLTGEYWSDDLARFVVDSDTYKIRLTIGGATLNTVKVTWTIKYTKELDAPLGGIVPGRSTMYIASSDCYSTVEKEIGCWIDGKPTYQITYYISALPSTAGNTTYSTGITGVEKVWLKDCIIGDSNGFNVRNDQDAYSSFRIASVTFRPSATDGEIKINCYNGQDRHTQTAYVTVMYTKTNDSAGSGKCVPSGENSIHYSFYEQIIGTWVDGNTLYRKTINFGQLPANSQKTVQHGITNLGIITKLYGTAIRPASEGINYNVIPLPATHYQTIGNQEELAVTGDYISIRNANPNANQYTSCYVTLEYTKASS